MDEGLILSFIIYMENRWGGQPASRHLGEFEDQALGALGALGGGVAATDGGNSHKSNLNTHYDNFCDTLLLAPCLVKKLNSIIAI
jgi:hypothetical protein